MSHPSMPFSGRGIEYQNVPVKNGALFWPDLNLAEFQKQRELPPNMDPCLMVIALLTSVKEINDALSDVVRIHSAKGHATAKDVPGASAGDENELTAQYKKAVYARTKVYLMGNFRPSAGARYPGRREAIRARACSLRHLSCCAICRVTVAWGGQDMSGQLEGLTEYLLRATTVRYRPANDRAELVRLSILGISAPG